MTKIQTKISKRVNYASFDNLEVDFVFAAIVHGYIKASTIMLKHC
jgi:hypothetical protein